MILSKLVVNREKLNFLFFSLSRRCPIWVWQATTPTAMCCLACSATQRIKLAFRSGQTMPWHQAWDRLSLSRLTQKVLLWMGWSVLCCEKHTYDASSCISEGGNWNEIFCVHGSFDFWLCFCSTTTAGNRWCFGWCWFHKHPVEPSLSIQQHAQQLWLFNLHNSRACVTFLSGQLTSTKEQEFFGYKLCGHPWCQPSNVCKDFPASKH